MYTLSKDYLRTQYYTKEICKIFIVFHCFTVMIQWMSLIIEEIHFTFDLYGKQVCSVNYFLSASKVVSITTTCLELLIHHFMMECNFVKKYI